MAIEPITCVVNTPSSEIAKLTANNAWTGNQTHAGTETFNGLVDFNYARNLAVETITTTDTLDATNDVVVCNSATAITVNLPSATGSGRTYQICNINTGTVTVDGNSSDTINGVTTQDIYQWEGIQVVDYSANKWIIK